MSAERILIAHPAADLYGSDLQLVEAVRALRAAGAAVRVVLPEAGPLHGRLRRAGAGTRVLPFPVLRASALSGRGIVPFAAGLGPAVAASVRLLRRARPDALVVNTLTLPWWVAAGRLAGVDVVVYCHEAEAQRPRPVQTALAAPLLGARAVVANSRATARVLTAALPSLAGRIAVVPNGVPDAGAPDSTSPSPRPSQATTGRPASMPSTATLPKDSPKEGTRTTSAASRRGRVGLT